MVPRRVRAVKVNTGAGRKVDVFLGEEMSQRDELLKALQRGEELTTLDALQRYGVMALSQRMTELQRAGYPVKSEMIDLPTGKRVARYSWTGQVELFA